MKGHTFNCGKKMSLERYENSKKRFFGIGNKIRNTGKTRFKKGHIHTKNWLIAMHNMKGQIRKKRKILFCKNCDKEFYNKEYSNRRKFCSRECYYLSLKEYRKIRFILECKQCHKEFTVTPANIKKIFCSQKCQWKSMEGREQKSNWIEKQRVQISGDKCWLWKGGISADPYGLEFNNQLKEQVRKRDRYRCQQCFRHQDELNEKLSIHHIDYDKKNNKSNNLISLCRVCHIQTNYSRDDWTNYFREMRIKANG